MKKEDVYIIGFPKSGNTWLTRLVAEVTSSKIKLTHSQDTLHNVENADDRDGPYLIHKIHYTYDLEKVIAAKKIYILRDPREVFVSGFFNNHRVISENNILATSILKKFFNYEVRGLSRRWRGNFFGRNFRRPFMNMVRYLFSKPKTLEVGNWSEHVNFWTKFSDIVVVRYEDLLENTEEVLHEILKNIGIEVDPDMITKTVNNQSFEKKKNKFINNGDTKNANFMRSGKKESWRKLIDKNLQTAIENDHLVVMSKYKYQVESLDVKA